MSFVLRARPETCSGCRACQLACSEAHGEGFNPSRSRLVVAKDDVGGVDQPIVCRFCDPAPCVNACLTGALLKTAGGWLSLRDGDCVACHACVAACPFDALKMDPSGSCPLACDGCDGHPACVGVCVTGALEIES